MAKKTKKAITGRVKTQRVTKTVEVEKPFLELTVSYTADQVMAALRKDAEARIYSETGIKVPEGTSMKFDTEGYYNGEDFEVTALVEADPDEDSDASSE